MNSEEQVNAGNTLQLEKTQRRSEKAQERRAFWRDLIRDKGVKSFCALVFFVLMFWFIGWGPDVAHGATAHWWSYLDPAIAATTLVIAWFVWLGETRERWIARLPLRLDLEFIWQKPETRYRYVVMKCDGAWLAHSGDIRQWGQQIGSQMAAADPKKRTARLSLTPRVDHTVVIRQHRCTEELSVCHAVTFYLADLKGDNCGLEAKYEEIKKESNESEVKKPWIYWKHPTFGETAAASKATGAKRNGS